ncbi:hypothetical protein GF314_15750 [bacterium]|nr:hypothetical protein [bacterium]
MAPPISRLVGWLYVGDLALAVAFVVNRLVGTPVIAFNHWLDLDRGESVPAWYLSAQLLVIAMVFGWFAAREASGSRLDRAVSWLPAATFTVLSIDAVAQLHDDIGRQVNELIGDVSQAALGSPAPHWGPLTIAVPLMIVMAIVFWRLRDRFVGHGRALALIAGGLALFAIGGAGVDAALRTVTRSGAIYVVQTVVGETLEMLGATTMLWGIALRLTVAAPAATR